MVARDPYSNREFTSPNTYSFLENNLSPTDRGLRQMLVLLVVSCISIVGWLAVARKDESVVASGKFVANYRPRSEPGELQRFLDSFLSSEIDILSVATGDSFKKGQVLVELDVEDVTIEMEHLQLEILSLNNQLYLNRSNNDQITHDLLAAEHRLALLNHDLRRRTIVAPYDGVVVETLQTKGNWVNVGTPILEIAPTDRRLLFRANVFPEDIGHVHVGSEVKVHPETYDRITEPPLLGRVLQIAPATVPAGDDAETGNYQVVIRLNDVLPANQVRLGTKGEVVIHGQVGADSMLSEILNRFLKENGKTRNHKMARAGS